MIIFELFHTLESQCAEPHNELNGQVNQSICAPLIRKLYTQKKS